MILDRLDPDRLYPARLAGRHAWAAWGLTTRQDDDTVVLLVPARDAPRLVPDITARAAVQLATPVWPSPTLPTVTTNADIVDVADGDHRARLQVVTQAWYLPSGGVPDHGDVVSVDGWPLIDEDSAIRDRFETLSQSSVGVEDVLDIANWVATKAAQARHGQDAPTHLSSVLDWLRRTAPDAYQAIGRVVSHAQQIHAQLPDPAQTAAAFTLLAAAINAPSNGIRRERSVDHTHSSTPRIPIPSTSCGRARWPAAQPTAFRQPPRQGPLVKAVHVDELVGERPMINRDDNPYPDGFGVVPPVLAGRDAEFSDLTAMLRRRAAGRYEEPRLLVGDRGYGKTVLLAELAAQARQPVTVTAGTNLVVNVTAVAWHTPATPKLRGHGAQYDPATPAFIAWGRIVGLESTAASTLTSGVRQPCPLSMQPSVRSPAVR